MVVAVGLGYAIYRGGVRINLSRFFRVTGFVLVLVAAGLLASAVHSLAEAGVVTQLQDPAFNLSWLVAPGSVRAALLTGMLGLQPVPTTAEVLVWLGYAIPMGVYVLWPPRPRSAQPEPKTAPSSVPAPTSPEPPRRICPRLERRRIRCRTIRRTTLDRARIARCSWSRPWPAQR